jgi:hypothetical protein
MLFMVIERFHEGKAPEIYRRYRDRGRMVPKRSPVHLELGRPWFSALLSGNGSRERSTA